MKTVFTNGRIILTDRILDGYSVIIEDGVISDVTKSTAAADKVVDLDGRYLAPGFIDMHTHGAGGQFNGRAGDRKLFDIRFPS